MNIEELTKKIEQELNLTKGLKNIKIHIQDFTNEEDTSYIEFKAIDKKNKRKVFKLYSKWSKIIKMNCPRISIEYNTPHSVHNDNLKKIIVKINGIINTNEKKDLLNQAALYFYQILKKELKYQK